MTRDGGKLLGVPVEAWPGVVLLLAAAAAMAIVNSPLGAAHAALLGTEFRVGYGDAAISLSVSRWVKNALMAVFFFFVGLELKRELAEGELSNWSAALLPAAGAAGGMMLPAGIYLLWAGATYPSGWAIPAATDIAFALGVLSLLGSRVPAALKAFLLAVAVVDDLGAILIVAVAYTEGVDLRWLAAAAAVFAALLAANRIGVRAVWAFVLLAVPLWIAMQNSGVNPTLAGVVTAAMVPLRDRTGGSPLHRAEHALRRWVHFGVMPVFALANAGVSLAGGVATAAIHPVALGIASGLALGKPLGIAGVALFAARLMRTSAPGTPLQLLGVSAIGGIGFTMSLFIGALAFADPALQAPVRVGVYAGSLLASLCGLALLVLSLPKRSPPTPKPAI